MTKQELEKMHKGVVKGFSVPEENRKEYYEYMNSISPDISEFKPVAHGRASNPLGSGLLNELSKPAGIEYRSSRQ